MPNEDLKVEVVLEEKVEMVDVKVNSSENGNISTSAVDNKVQKGKDLIINVHPNNGYKLAALTINGSDVISNVKDNQLVYKGVDRDIEISAAFVIDTNKQELQKKYCFS